MDGNQKPVDKRELSPESQEVVECMREQIETEGYPPDDIVDQTAEILFGVLQES